MISLFLNRVPTAWRHTARGGAGWGMVLLIVFALAAPAGAGPLPPRQLEPFDQAYVAPPAVTFRWAPTEGAEWYYVEIYREDQSTGLRVPVDGDSTSYTYSGLEPGYSYIWKVDVDVATTGSDQDFFAFTLADQPIIPMTPEDIHASDGNYDDEIIIEWPRTQRTAYYLLQRLAPGGAEFVDLARVNDDRTFADREPEAEQHYQYRVLSCNSAGCSPPSPPDEGWVGACHPVAAPKLVSPLNGAEIHFTWQDAEYHLEWEAVPGAPGHRVRVWDTITGNTLVYDLLDTPGSDWYAVMGVAGDLAWNVTATNPTRGCPNSPPSETWTYRAIQNPPPAIPVNVQASDGAHPDRVVVTWEQPETESVLESWQILRATSPDPQQAVEIGAIPAGVQPYVDSDVTPGTVYYYWIEACSHGDGCSAKSDWDSGFAGEAPLFISYPIFIPYIGQ